jgi:oligopeptide transport system permease protein
MALAGERPVSRQLREVLTEKYHLNEPFLCSTRYYMRGLLTASTLDSR